MGRPLVASRTGGTPELIVDGETGLIFPPGDAAALADAGGRAARRSRTPAADGRGRPRAHGARVHRRAARRRDARSLRAGDAPRRSDARWHRPASISVRRPVTPARVSPCSRSSQAATSGWSGAIASAVAGGGDRQRQFAPLVPEAAPRDELVADPRRPTPGGWPPAARRRSRPRPGHRPCESAGGRVRPPRRGPAAARRRRDAPGRAPAARAAGAPDRRRRHAAARARNGAAARARSTAPPPAPSPASRSPRACSIAPRLTCPGRRRNAASPTTAASATPTASASGDHAAAGRSRHSGRATYAASTPVSAKNGAQVQGSTNWRASLSPWTWIASSPAHTPRKRRPKPGPLPGGRRPRRWRRRARTTPPARTGRRPARAAASGCARR